MHNGNGKNLLHARFLSTAALAIIAVSTLVGCASSGSDDAAPATTQSASSSPTETADSSPSSAVKANGIALKDAEALCEAHAATKPEGNTFGAFEWADEQQVSNQDGWHLQVWVDVTSDTRPNVTDSSLLTCFVEGSPDAPEITKWIVNL